MAGRKITKSGEEKKKVRKARRDKRQTTHTNTAAQQYIRRK
jgi:hypothetical protein